MFKEFKEASTDGDLDQDDDSIRKVETMINGVQSFDFYADRSRFQENRNGNSCEGIGVNLDDLFLAHWMIVSRCEGTVAKLGEEFGVGVAQL